MAYDLLECAVCFMAKIVPKSLYVEPSFCPLPASRSGLWVNFGDAAGGACSAQWDWVLGGGRPYGDFLMTHFLPPCCCTEAISRLPASPLCSIRQAEGGVFVCSHWFPHTPCCQDTERCRRANSCTGTLQDHCLAQTPTWMLSHYIQCLVQLYIYLCMQQKA